MKALIWISVLIFSSFVFAEESKTAGALKTQLNGALFEATLNDGFHFNEQAPNQVTVDGQGLKPEKSKPRELVFRLPSKAYESGRASLYVCDDAQTFCQPNTVDFKASGKTSDDGKLDANMPPKKITLNEFGFIEDNLRAAGEKARKEKKLILLDFSARWCPGCIRLENEIFGTKEFRSATKRFVKVRLDYDRFENLVIAKQYNVHVIPSLLALTPALEEISRIDDFQPMPTVAAFLTEAQKNPLPFSELQKKADAGNSAAALSLGERLYSGFQFEKSALYLEKIQPPPIELADARVQAAKADADKDEKLKSKFQKIARDAIAAEPASSRSIVWRTYLAESLSEKDPDRKKIAAEGLAVGDEILAHPEKLKEALRGDAVGEFAGLESLYVASERADLAESAGLDEPTQQAALLKVTEIGRSLKISIEKKGPALRYLIFLVAAHQYVEAEVQVRALIKHDPQNPELQRRLLRILNAEKKYPEAITVGRETLPHSFGKNEVWVAQQLAKAYLGAGQKLEAKALAQGYLARTDIDWTMMKSEQKDLTELAKSIQ
jgi:thiol-disulfide isomerase/thioredoxin